MSVGPEMLDDNPCRVGGDGRAAGGLKGAVGGRAGGDLEAARLADLSLDIDGDRQRVVAGDVDHVAVMEHRVARRGLVVQIGAVIYRLLGLGIAARHLDFAEIGVEGGDGLLQNIIEMGVGADDVMPGRGDQPGHVHADAADPRW